ncbi:MAG: histidine phosphatase family protein [Firmicutes bacterium]|nr:histidine phosphatase family protein [Bacillota bacterium]
MEIYLIRHGKTRGNLEGRYIGSTDEPLCPQGRSELAERKNKGIFPPVAYVFSSPLKRCLETAEIFFPDRKVCPIDGLRECDFGDFENKNYQELAEDFRYQRWIDSNGTLPFPAGEKQGTFRKRCAAAFAEIVNELFREKAVSAAVVAHGGTIMSILERYAEPEKSFYNWQIKNGEGYHIVADEAVWQKKHRVQVIEYIK